jgi:signal transduction histidine kinase
VVPRTGSGRRAYLGPVLALTLIALLEGLYDSGIPVISPSVVLLLPVVFAAANAGWRATTATVVVAVAYQFRHYYLNRGEYVSLATGLSADDFSRILIFLVAALGLVAIARYRDQQRQAQLSMEEAYRTAVAANQAKSRFLAVVSHELRTPLTAIIQYTDLLDAGVGGELGRDQKQMLRRIEGGALMLRALIQRLLDYAHFERGEVRVRKERLDLVVLVRETASLLEPMAAEKGLELRVEPPSEPVPADTDPDRLRQIVINLAENAIRFTDQGTVTVGLAAVASEPVLWVADTGVGIAPEALPRIFEPFWQGEEALTRRRGGLGLGLAITREVVTALGGQIAVESEVGRGSVFRVTLPRPSPGGRDIL